MGNLCSNGTKSDADFRPYVPVRTVYPVSFRDESETGIPRCNDVGSKFEEKKPVVQDTLPPPQVQHKPPKLFIVGDNMTIQNEDCLVEVKCVDNATAKWRRAQPSTKIANELEILRSLNHPNVIRVLFTFSVNDVQHIAYEPVKNSLSSSVRSLQSYKDVVYQLVDAVEYLQARRIVHLSLTPENIFVIEDNRKQVIKIGSFGFAFRMTSHVASVAVGVPKHLTYSAPEVYDGTGVCLASDIYSLGQVIFFVFSKGGYLMKASGILGIVVQRFDGTKSSKVLCADLILKLVTEKATKRLEGDQIKKHPFFWDADKTVNFIIEVNKLIEAGDENFRKCLWINSKNALNEQDDWSASVEEKVRAELNDSRKEFLKRTGRSDFSTGKKNIISLIQVMRHVTVHSQKSNLIREVMGLSNEDYLKFWLDRFPNLIHHMYNAKLLFEDRKFELPRKRIRTSKAKNRH